MAEKSTARGKRLIGRSTSGDINRGGRIGSNRGQDLPNASENLVLHSAATLTTVLRAIPDMVWAKDRNGVYRGCNAAFENLLGCTEAEILGKTDSDFAHRGCHETGANQDREVLETNEPLMCELEIGCTANDTRRLYEVAKTPLRDAAGKTVGVLSIARDISGHKETEQALAWEARRRQMLMDISYDGIAIFNEAHQIVEANKRFAEMLGYTPEEVVGLYSWDFDAVFTEEDIRSGFPVENVVRNIIETKHRRKDGSIYDAEVSANGAVIEGRFLVITITRDISDRKEKERLTRQVGQMQKMQAIGQLSAGVAHDFNNVLTGILGAAKLLARYLPDNPKARATHQLILDSADRAASLIDGLMDFSREGPHESVPVEIHGVIESTLKLLCTTMDKCVQVETALRAAASTIVGDAAQLQNMLLNLCINSMHAMPDGGTLSIATREWALGRGASDASMFDITPGPYIEIDVRDTGCGIPKELQDKIFEPFFTTKEVGMGTGLGLPSVFGTVQRHHGSVTVRSEVGRGTLFRILLPLEHQEAVA